MSAPPTRTPEPEPGAEPPRLPLWLLRTLISEPAADPYLGDLLERFDDLCATEGESAARRALWRDVTVAIIRMPWRRPRIAHPRGDPLMSAFTTDLRFAARRLRRAPSFASLSALTLALGIGATTAVFGVAYSALLRPLPFPDAGRLVDAAETNREGRRTTVSPPNFYDMKQASRTLDMAAWNDPTVALTSDGPAEQLPAAQVTRDFFRVLRVQPALGRAFTDAESAWHGPKAVVLGHRLWMQRFGGDPHVVGRTIRIEGVSREVVGVMPAGFDYPSRARLWLPLAFSDSDLVTQRGAHWLRVTGRLRPGATIEGAHADLKGIMARLEAAYPDKNTDRSAAVRSLRDATVGDVRPALYVLLGGGALLLLLACANVANLLLARATRQERDRVVRAALGASGGALAREVMSESLLLSLGGGALGIALAWWGTHALDATLRVARPSLAESHVDGPVLGFALALSVLTALAFGLLPAIGASRIGNIESTLRAARHGGGSWSARLRGSLVVAQIAITTLLLSGAALLGESFARLRNVDVGFTPAGVWTFALSLPEARYTEPRMALFYRELLDRVRAIPGVRAAGATIGLPLSGTSFQITVHELDGVPEPEATARAMSVRMITDDYVRAVGMRLLRGRPIVRGDDAGAPRVVVVNESLARMLWPGQDPMGRRFTIGMRVGPDSARERVGGTVVGVVKDVRGDAVRSDPLPEAYFSMMQFPLDGAAFAVQAEPTPALARAIREQVAALDPEIPLAEERTLDQLVGDAVAEPRLYSLLFGAFAGTALLLACVGVYGVLSLAVGQRTREFGVRIALGARAADVGRLVLRQAARPVVAGLALGLVASLASSRVLRAMLFGVSATDPVVYVVVTFVLAAAAVVAVLVPTLRATGVSPTVALREE